MSHRRLIVTIPALNEEEHIADVINEVPREIDGFDSVCVLVVDDGSSDRTAEIALEAGADWVFSNPVTMGLGFTFQRGLMLALEHGADVIVNTDGDNHYDQTAIPGLIEPIVAARADIVIGSRIIDRADMPGARFWGNRIANRLMQVALGQPGLDVSTGFRAYSREAALRTFTRAKYTYTHETLLSAIDQAMIIANYPVRARKVMRPSRLMSGVANHVFRAGLIIARSFLIYRPMTTYPFFAALMAIPGLLVLGRFLIEYAQGNGAGHTQSLVIGMGLVVIAVQVFVLGLLAYAIRDNRRVLQELLRNSKDQITSGEGATVSPSPAPPSD